MYSYCFKKSETEWFDFQINTGHLILKGCFSVGIQNKKDYNILLNQQRKKFYKLSTEELVFNEVTTKQSAPLLKQQ